MLRALEFYSGVGAFAQACKLADWAQIEIVRAFDQNPAANETYFHNWGERPCSLNLDSIPLNEIPEADIWWLSPPCTPYTRRGERKDIEDNRALSFLRLIDFMTVRKPSVIIVENVEGFLNSRTFDRLASKLDDYCVSTVSLCSSQFGVPMRRPRVFVVATKKKHKPLEVPLSTPSPLAGFIGEVGPFLDEKERLRYEPVLNIVDGDDPSSICICFTSGYYRCRKASGSLLKVGGRLRFFSPAEISSLLGFQHLEIPAHLGIKAAYKLVGNSVDVRVIRHILSSLHVQGVLS